MDNAGRLASALRIKDALLTAMEAGAGKPGYTIDGQTVTWGELFDRMAKVDAMIAAIQGPIEVYSEH